jgi:hypothetical protein
VDSPIKKFDSTAWWSWRSTLATAFAAGDRQLKRALHMIAMTNARIDPQIKAYVGRKRAEGKTGREALRCLKRHLARKIHRVLSMPAVDPSN